MEGREGLTGLRRELHRRAEPADQEERTAAFVAETLSQTGPAELRTGLGGHGVAALYPGAAPGPTVLLRADLDALPQPDSPELPHASIRPGVAHKCGHDGHMAILLGVARSLGTTPPRSGRAVLLFQPAEETGQGARRVLEDPAFADWKPDRTLALHNLPGYPSGSIVLREGLFASASRGLVVELEGATSHAAEPEKGRSPALAVAQLVQRWSAVAQFDTALHECAQVTVIHASLGERAFGTSPGHGRVLATLRSHRQDVMDRLAARCVQLAEGIAACHELRCHVSWTEEFPATENDAEVAEIVRAVAKRRGLELHRPEHPFAWSEDFGHFTAAAPGVLFGLGAGIDHPPLHHPDYDFPDELLDIGSGLMEEILRTLLEHPRRSDAP